MENPIAASLIRISRSDDTIREILFYSVGLVTGATAALLFNLMINR